MSVIVKTCSSASLPEEIFRGEDDATNTSVAVDALAAEVYTFLNYFRKKNIFRKKTSVNQCSIVLNEFAFQKSMNI